MKKNLNHNRELTKEWLDIADNDLGFAKAAFNDFDDFYAQMCVQAHQAAEKYLKSFLVFHNVKFRRVHDLAHLVRECAKIDKDFKQRADDCEKITDYYAFLRYPAFLPARTKKEAKETIKIADDIGKLVKSKIKFI